MTVLDNDTHVKLELIVAEKDFFRKSLLLYNEAYFYTAVGTGELQVRETSSLLHHREIAQSGTKPSSASSETTSQINCTAPRVLFSSSLKATKKKMAMSDSSTASFDWHPARLLRDQDDVDDFALLVLNQPLRNGAHLRKLWKKCM